MRIVFYSHMGQLGNGANESFLGIVSGLSQKHECFVITPYKGTLNEELDNLKINNTIIPFKWSSQSKNDYKKVSFIDSLKTVNKWFSVRRFNEKVINQHLIFLKEFNPDIIYSNTSVINIGVALAEKLKVKHIWHIREFQFYDITPNFGYFYLKKYLKKSEVIIVNSNLLKSYYSKFIKKDKIKVVYNGIDISSNTIDRKNKKDVFVFLIVGSLIKRKSHFEALEAVKQLKLRNDKFQLHIVGEGRLRSEMEFFIKENDLEDYVRLFGHQNNVEQFYKGADCYLMCSELESFGRVTVEAMLNTLPVIGRLSKYNATKEIIRDGIDGVLYENVNELITKMEWMMNNSDLRLAMGKSGEARARENFSLEHSIYQMEEILLSFQNSIK
ncbi:glycosyltransferase family 4 protein [Flavobacterium sp. LC2016-01]|uniref:glycosyltransferase family 4 protein n=1 Tax=Flavobacterium sp. LC2016-01 TaxID=2675876 RepID=UPI0012BA89DD|nr:glycosyltransferase family 4 protein [Flavobacterium sp. LC2016-01]MTH17534.1 glycosyltransferase [Flavobacterium sp. LC2016-01]